MPRGVYKREKKGAKLPKVAAKKKPRKWKVAVAAEPFMVTDDLVKSEVSLREIEEADLRRRIKEWYDEAPSTAERQKRKTAMMGLMYGGNAAPFEPEKFLNMPKRGEWVLTETSSKEADSTTNPKTLTGQSKVPVLSVVPPASIIAQATAMRYGAFLAPKVDGTKGYGPYNWRDQPIEAHIYIDAAMRHLMQWFDGDDSEVIYDDEGHAIDTVSHLAFALATIGILLDAKANETLIDDRPKVRKMAASTLLNYHKLAKYDR